MSRGSAASATFFGKVPGRGDFVKGAGQHPLIGTLDAWVSGAMELLAEDPGWKAAYDAAGPIDFAFVGARSGVSVVGHLRPSVDASGRRFPFLAAAALERLKGRETSTRFIEKRPRLSTMSLTGLPASGIAAGL